VSLRLCAALLAAVLASGAAPLAVWLDVPFVRQPEEGCGAASIAMILRYWHARGALPAEPAAPEEIFQALYVPARHGIPAGDLARYLETRGLRTFALRGQWTDLEEHLAAGRPLIVALKVPGGLLHYAVAAGIGADTVALNDPADRKLRLHARRAFERQWEAAGRWTLLAVPAGLR
jgi:predicted double-glycine peptidase